MDTTIDLGGAPANEDCAQLDHTHDFDRLNRLEVKLYAVAMQARFGPPPQGCAFTTISNRHDFGTYHTLGLKVLDSHRDDPEVARYIENAEDGLGSWLEAGITPPIDYEDGQPRRVRRDHDAIVRGALATTRPNPDGTFAIPDFAILHGNLCRAFPRVAEAFFQSTRAGTPA